jgi:succinate dehydrogenase/fumarate reductase cytochrome b subunit
MSLRSKGTSCLRSPSAQDAEKALLELLLLLCVTTHALLGVRAIFLDLGLSQRAERHLDLVLKIVGC